jgi:hypothetical protein
MGAKPKNQTTGQAHEIAGKPDKTESSKCVLWHFTFLENLGITHPPWAHPIRLQRFVLFSTLLMISTIWGVCFSLEANPNASNQRSFATVLPRYDGEPDQCWIRLRDQAVTASITETILCGALMRERA